MAGSCRNHRLSLARDEWLANLPAGDDVPILAGDRPATPLRAGLPVRDAQPWRVAFPAGSLAMKPPSFPSVWRSLPAGGRVCGSRPESHAFQRPAWRGAV